jgi:hypothetical protein
MFHIPEDYDFIQNILSITLNYENDTIYDSNKTKILIYTLFKERNVK